MHVGIIILKRFCLVTSRFGGRGEDYLRCRKSGFKREKEVVVAKVGDVQQYISYLLMWKYEQIHKELDMMYRIKNL